MKQEQFNTHRVKRMETSDVANAVIKRNESEHIKDLVKICEWAGVPSSEEISQERGALMDRIKKFFDSNSKKGRKQN
jgi:hypothetical protein